MLEHTFWNYFAASGDPEIYLQYRAYCSAQEEQKHGSEYQDEGADRERSSHGRTGQTPGDPVRG